MKLKLFINIFSILMLLVMINNTTAQIVSQHDGEYATDLTIFEFELTSVDDQTGWLKIFWGFNSTGDSIRFEIGTSVLSEDYVDVYYDGVYKIPIEIFINDVELDVNSNATYFNFWEEEFWSKIILPIEDGQYNNFDVLEDQEPAKYDVKGDEVSYFTAQSEKVYDYQTGILLSWTSTVTYNFVLLNIAPPEISSDTPTESDESIRDRLPISSSMVFVSLISVIVVRKLFFKISKI
ncbi:MAG: hypothetical protein HeimC2_44370 [Candidatus Heimdallarchaeota archaeon LC_2]|nr:MAG: hypothetical protein HeimC2_44370 [Candidatus Heimdallarchaeota archaeon LC_2]